MAGKRLQPSRHCRQNGRVERTGRLYATGVPLLVYANGVGEMEFIEAPAFTRLLPEYFQEDDYAKLQMELQRNPEAGELMLKKLAFTNYS